MTWLSESAFNLLIDYYTEVLSRPYGSGASRKNILPWLKQLDLGYVCIYAKGHSGYTTWRSSLKTEHPMLAQDMPDLFRKLTKEAGCRLVLYYSGLLDGLAGERHPDWVMRDRNGQPAGAFFKDFNVAPALPVCPRSPYWDEWVKIQLRELIDRYHPDGIWVDGDWPGPCYCERCLEKFREDYGVSGSLAELRNLPQFDNNFSVSWNRITHQWRTQFRDFVKSLKPDCAYSAGNVTLWAKFAAPFDWRSGDFFSPGFFNLHDIARMMRWYGTMAMPYDAYICDTSFRHELKHVRSRSKTLLRMKQEAATVAANGGAVGYWTYPLGNGAWVPSRMRKAVEVRKFIREREDIFCHTQSVPWTLILATDESQPTFGNNGVKGAHKALAALHRSPDIRDASNWQPNLPYKLIVIPEQAVISPQTVSELEKYVLHGGKLLTTGSSITSLQKLIGVSLVRRNSIADGHVILKTRDEPTGVDSPWDKVECVDARELYRLFLSWDQFNSKCRNLANNWPMHGQMDEENPEYAGMPAAVVRDFGRGHIVHICTSLFEQYFVLGDPQILAWVREILGVLQPDPLFETDAPSWVDVSVRKKEDRLLIHFVNQNPGRDLSKQNTYDLWGDEIPIIGPITVSLQSSTRPESLSLIPSGEAVDFSFSNGVVSFVLPRLHIHECSHSELGIFRVKEGDFPFCFA